MRKKLIIVESPAKARTISSMLDDSYAVLSSVGHVRDLPRTRFGVDVEHGFKPEYVTISGKQNTIDKIKKASKEAEIIFLAADPDREGEAICWHLAFYLEGTGTPIHRIMYYEITPQAIRNSLQHPDRIKLSKVNAQQARRVLDRIVGYRLSPLLWTKIRRGLSAGRVQSIALKLICDREREIQAFEPKEYWILKAVLDASQPPAFLAVYFGSNGKRLKIHTGEEAAGIRDDVQKHPFVVKEVSKRKVSRQPPAPFITSTLQQEAARRYRFTAQKTMRLAQSLYEGKQTGSDTHHGLITYMRTDSPRISKEAQTACRDLIVSKYGERYVPSKPPVYKARKSAQEAHEAIRPTSVSLTPQDAARYLTGDELKLYVLVWERFVASQMAPALLNVTTIKLDAGSERTHQFRATGSEVVFNGFWELTGSPPQIAQKQDRDTEQSEKNDPDSEEFGNQILPVLKESDETQCRQLDASQHFTKPPPRFTEATLVRELETQGIGRPSTYATIMAVIREHDYVSIHDRKFHPTDLGFTVSDLLSENFPEIMSPRFTADLENRLDKVEEGREEWTELLSYFYDSFNRRLLEAQQTVKSFKSAAQFAEGVSCPICQSRMVIRWGKRGRFLSCERFPECRGILPYQKTGPVTGKKPAGGIEVAMKCPDCGSPMALKKGRYGLFISCSKFPKCKGKPPKPEGLPCAAPGCDGRLAARRSKNRRIFWGCSRYPECNFIMKSLPILEKCPECGFDYLGASARKNAISIICPRCQSVVNNIEEEATLNAESDPEIPDIS